MYLLNKYENTESKAPKNIATAKENASTMIVFFTVNSRVGKLVLDNSALTSFK